MLPRPPSFSTPTTFARDDIQAGSRPEATAATSIAATVNASTGTSMSKVIHDGGGFVEIAQTVADSQPTDTYGQPDADGGADGGDAAGSR